MNLGFLVLVSTVASLLNTAVTLYFWIRLREERLAASPREPAPAEPREGDSHERRRRRRDREQLGPLDPL